MTPEQRYSRSEEAKSALAQFLAPAFDIVEAEYTRKLTELAAESPWEAGKISKLAMALKISRAARAQIEAIVQDGKEATAQLDRAGQIAKISDHKRRILGL